VGACRRQAEPAPTLTTRRKEFLDGQPPHPSPTRSGRRGPRGGPDDWIHDHHRPAERTSEQTFDRLNPTFGVPADRTDRIGHRDVAQHEAALALGVRVAVHDSRQNDPNPHVWQPGQDYRAADALQAARHQFTRARRGPERIGPER
jgi:hypothetical protein